MITIALSYNNETSATVFAQFSGVMAGFAFTALVLVLTRSHEDRSGHDERGEHQSTAAAFFVAFANLVFATLMYTAVSGEVHLSNRAATETLLSDAGFFVAMLQVFLSLVILMTQLKATQASYLARVLAGIIVPITGYAYIYQDAARSPSGQLLPFYLSLIIFAVAMCVGIVRSYGSFAVIPKPRLLLLNSVSLGYVCLCAVLVAVAQAYSPSFALPSPLVYIILFSLAAMQGLYCYMAFTVGKERRYAVRGQAAD